MTAGVEFLLILALSVAWLSANPSGGTVAGGSANISTAPGQVTVTQGSDRAVVNWQQFSIKQGETTTFVQPGASSSVLNRVTGGQMSQLDGALNANGRVYLVNPQGVVVGKTGRVNTGGGFTASALDLSDAQFMKGGDLNYSGNSSAKVVNLGKIRATDGDVTLIARQVENHGKISAKNGRAQLAAGTEVLIKSSGAERVFIQPGSAGASGQTGVINTSRINAAVAELKAAGGNEYALAIRNSGTVRATGSRTEGGRVYLTSSGGRIVNSGKIRAVSRDGSGGQIRIAGGNITLTSGSQLDASGSDRKGGAGGTVLVGGEWQGSGTMEQAKSVTVEQGAELLAYATAAPGSATPAAGGTVVLWSTGLTDFSGGIQAWGVNGGAGGRVETSGHDLSVSNAAMVLTGGGEWLLDPYDLTIVATGGASGTVAIANAVVSPTSTSIDASVIVNALASGSVMLLASNSIIVNALIDSTGNGVVGSLALNAPRLDLNAPILLFTGSTLSSTASVVNVGVLSPTVQGRIQNAVDAVATGGTINVAAGTFVENIITSAKSLSINGAGSGPGGTIVDGNAAGSVFIINGAISDTVTLNGLEITNGNSTLGGGGVNKVSPGTLTISNSTLSGNSALRGGAVVFDNGGTVTITNSTLSGNSVVANGGAISSIGNGDLLITNSILSGNSARFGGAIYRNSTATIQISDSTLSGNSASFYGGAILASLFETVQITNSTLSGNTADAGGAIHNNSNGSFTITNSTLSGNSSSTVGGAIYNLRPITIANSTFSGNSASTDGGAIFNSGTVTMANSTLSGNSSLTQGGAIYNYTDIITTGILNVGNSIIAQNSAPTGPNVFGISGTIVDQGYNLLGSTAGSTGFGATGTQIVADSAVGLAPLGNYGGPTQTMALLVGSPALNAGNSLLTTDQRGQTRNGVPDIGAYEAGATPMIDFTVRNTSDYAPAVAPIANSLRMALTFAEAPATVAFDMSAVTPGPGGVWKITAATGTTGFTIARSTTIDATGLPGYAPGKPVLVVDGNALGTVFTINSITGYTVALNGLGIVNGYHINRGGGIAAISSGTVQITSSTFIGNSAREGGAVYNNGGTVEITNSTFSGNTSSYGGGAIYARSGTVVTNSTFNGNSAQFGGAIYNDNSTLQITNSTFNENYAVYNGGAIHNSTGSLTITSSTLVGNSSSSIGGAISDFSLAGIRVSNSIIAQNNSPNGPNLKVDNAIVDLGYNLVGNTTGSTGFQNGVNGTMVIADSAVGVGPLGNYGGPTQTMALLLGSPALNAGNSALPTDQRGHARNGAPDIGAYEAGTAPLTADYVVRTTADYAPAAAPIANSLRVALTLVEAPTNVTFAIPDSDPGKVAGISTIRAATGTTGFTITRGITIDGTTQAEYVAGGSPVIIVDGNGLGTVFNITAASDQTVALRGLVITGGSGRGVSNGGATLNVSGSVFRGNTAGDGAAIYSDSGIVDVADSIFSGNAAGFGGGAIFITTGNVTITNSSFSGNRAQFGGAISSIYGTLSITNSTIDGNTARVGGGIYIEYSTLTVNNTTISGNSVSGPSAGGGIQNAQGRVNILNSTITGNSATGNGGGISSSAFGTTDLSNSIVAQNTAGGSGANLFGSVVDAGYNLVGITAGVSGAGFVNGVNGTLVVADSAVGLAPLGNYGGPTQTIALLPGSPALDAGNSALLTDQRGLSRFGAPDIGAFESQGFTYTLTGGGSAVLGSTFAPVNVTIAANNPVEPVAGGAVTLVVPGSGATATGTLTLTLSGTGSATFSDLVAAGRVGTYNVSIRNMTAAPGGGLSLTNLVIAHIIITPGTGQGKIYGATDPLFTFGASIPVTLSGRLGRAPGENVGLYAFDIADFIAQNTSYTIALAPGSSSFVIRPALLTITATNASGTDGEPLPALAGTITGFQFNDTAAVISGLSYTSVASSTSPAGTYEIVPVGGTAANYIFLRLPGLLTLRNALRPVPPLPPLPDMIQPTMDLTAFNATLGRNNQDEEHFLYLNDANGNVYYAAPTSPSVSGSIYSSSSFLEFRSAQP